MALKLTKGEYDAFWDEVLGDDWAIEEWSTTPGDEVVDGLNPDEFFTIEFIALDWQAYDRQPEPTKWITARQLAGNGPDFIRLFREWKRQQSVQVVAVEVPADKLDELDALLKGIGAKRMK